MAKVASPAVAALAGDRDPHPAVGEYLVKAYAWRVMLANGGPIDWLLGAAGTAPATA